MTLDAACADPGPALLTDTGAKRPTLSRAAAEFRWLRLRIALVRLRPVRGSEHGANYLATLLAKEKPNAHGASGRIAIVTLSDLREPPDAHRRLRRWSWLQIWRPIPAVLTASLSLILAACASGSLPTRSDVADVPGAIALNTANHRSTVRGRRNRHSLPPRQDLSLCHWGRRRGWQRRGDHRNVR